MQCVLKMLAAVLESVIYMIQDSSLLEYQTYIQPHTRQHNNEVVISELLVHYRPLFTGPKTVQASVTLLDSLPIFLEKTNKEELEEDIIPMLYLAMESSMSQVVDIMY